MNARAPHVSRPHQDPNILGLSADSRAVQPGYLFAAIRGEGLDGRSYIPDALERGAVCVLTDLREPLPAPTTPEGERVPVIAVENPRRSLALMAARFFGAQPHHVAAVTGTSGKTSVASFTREIWTRLGRKAASMGTLGLVAPGMANKGALTTPDPIALHAELARLAQAGITNLAIEASSHGLDQSRLDGIDIEAGGFTNLSRDHLDYHANMDTYLAAKLRLFDAVMPPGRAAVLNTDSPEYDAFAAVAARRRHRIIGYGRRQGELRLMRQTPVPDGQALALNVFGRMLDVHLPLPGAFQAHNALCAAGLAIACGAEPAEAIEALAHLSGVRGRLERVATLANGAQVYVDYSHKPGALESVLETLRPLARRRLLVVFGCGGDRDRGKRPEMGAVACRLADRVIVTDDNPRTEDPAEIRRAVLDGCPAGAAVSEIGGRAAAIAAAIAELDAGDLLVIAGKGHEQEQIIGKTAYPFDDAEVARAAVAALARKAPHASGGPDAEANGHGR